MADTALDAYDAPELKPIAATCCDCGAKITLSQFCVATSFHANAVCKRRGWQSLGTNEVSGCDDCNERLRLQRQRASAKSHERLMELTGRIRDAMRAHDRIETDRAVAAIPPDVRLENEDYIAAILAGNWLERERKNPRSYSE